MFLLRIDMNTVQRNLDNLQVHVENSLNPKLAYSALNDLQEFGMYNDVSSHRTVLLRILVDRAVLHFADTL